MKETIAQHTWNLVTCHSVFKSITSEQVKTNPGCYTPGPPSALTGVGLWYPDLLQTLHTLTRIIPKQKHACLSVWRFTWCKRTSELIREALVDNLLNNEESSLKSRTRNYAVCRREQWGWKLRSFWHPRRDSKPTWVSNHTCRKISKKSPGAFIFKGPFWGFYIRRGLYTEENLRFKIEWASPTVGSKFTF